MNGYRIVSVTFVLGVAAVLGLECEPSGEATCRRREKEAGLEGDRTFHFGANAEQMRGEGITTSRSIRAGPRD